MKSKLYYLGIIAAFFFGAAVDCYGSNDYLLTFDLDGEENCTSTEGNKKASNFDQKAIHFDLPKGMYSFECLNGAYSKWEDRYTAKSQGQEPWLCYARISTKIRDLRVGKDRGYKDPKTAIERNKDYTAELELKEATTVYVWIEDTWDGVDYCEGNRGVVTIGVKKLY